MVLFNGTGKKIEGKKNSPVRGGKFWAERFKVGGGGVVLKRKR